MNSKQDAIDSAGVLQGKFQKKFNDADITFITGYNPSHLAGLGDLVQSAAQMLDSSISDHDLNTILTQIEPYVTTRKILLVGHSQGTFYTNSLYQYLINHGVPKESIAIYNVATPASEVAGNGGYLTSSNDAAIRAVAQIAQKLQILPPLSANINIPIYPEDTESDYPGHDFIRAYIAGASDQIISGISQELNNLTAKANTETSETCFTAPQLTVGDKLQDVAFVPFDFVANVGAVAFGAIEKGAGQTATVLVKGISSVANTLASVFGTTHAEQASVVLNAITQNKTNLLSSGERVFHKDDLLIYKHIASREAPSIAEERSSLAQESTSVLQAGETIVNNDGELSQTEKKEKEKSPRQAFVPMPSIPSPGFGGGDSTSQSAVSLGTQTDTQIQTDTTSPSAPAIIVPADFLRTFTSSAITFSGTAEAGSIISTSVSPATTTASQSGEWSVALTFNQGTTTAQFFATDSAGNISQGASTTLFVDSTAPQAITPVIAECANSLATSGCLLAATTLSVSWGASEAADFNYFIINNNGAVSTTTAASTTAAATNNTTYSFALSAVDKSGNTSATTTVTAEINTSPVVINEVAWGGTNASTADEWVELYNKSTSAVNLSGFTLYAADGAPYIPLSGAIPAGGYYLIERKNTGETDEATQSPVKDVVADLWTSFGSGLSNTGENLILSHKGTGATTTMDEISYCYNWCGKGSDSPEFRSMERFDAEALGTDWSNWERNQIIIRNGVDASGNALNGTPKAYNSFSRLLNKGSQTITQDMTLKKSKSPYVVNNTIVTLQAGKMLTLEPGAVIKFYNNARLAVSGALNAQGTENDPVVFTSFLDDAYGGDTNQDGALTSPAKGAWYGVELASGSDASVFDHAIFRYGGKYYDGQGQPAANLYLANTSPSINHSTFEYGGQHGLRLFYASSSISNSVFQHNGSGYWMGGVMSTGGAPTIDNNQFSDNVIGIYLVSSEARVSSNTLASSTSEAIYASGVVGDGYFSGNSGSKNAWNGITLAGNITKTGVTTTLKQNTLPYLIERSSSATVIASSTLAINPGVTVKFGDDRLFVNGDLSISGTGASPVTLTSIYDDSDGNDASNNGASIGVAGNVQGTILQSGSSSTISGAVFKFMKTALSYLNSPMVLSNTIFSDNTLAVSADASTISNYPITALNITFNNNTATTSPAGLW
ncbi:MAG: lamin tail domain-containing protein [Candidatus Lloydbacteria bacterium]|nr:lamin tail domain-containing protein [Candidatus Lloydbacteria bacterium]